MEEDATNISVRANDRGDIRSIQRTTMFHCLISVPIEAKGNLYKTLAHWVTCKCVRNAMKAFGDKIERVTSGSTDADFSVDESL